MSDDAIKQVTGDAAHNLVLNSMTKVWLERPGFNFKLFVAVINVYEGVDKKNIWPQLWKTFLVLSLMSISFTNSIGFGKVRRHKLYC